MITTLMTWWMEIIQPTKTQRTRQLNGMDFTNVRTGVYGILPRSDWVFFSQTLCRDLGGFFFFHSRFLILCFASAWSGSVNAPFPTVMGKMKKRVNLEKIRLSCFQQTASGLANLLECTLLPSGGKSDFHLLRWCSLQQCRPCTCCTTMDFRPTTLRVEKNTTT